MHIRPHRPTGGGFVLFFCEDHAPHIDYMRLSIPREYLSTIARHAILEIGMDASIELLDLCREITDLTRKEDSHEDVAR